MKTSERAVAKIKIRAIKTVPGEKCECCGRAFEHPRNAGRHRAFFAMLKPAFENWPERHDFQPVDLDELRGWLLCRAKWCETERIEFAVGNRNQIVAAMTAFMTKQRGKRSHFQQTSTGLMAYTPKSIAFTKCREVDFRRIIDDVTGIIETEIGVSIADLKQARAA